MLHENLQIIKVEIFQSPIKLKEPFTISLGTLLYAENIIIKIYTNSSIIGFGECSPFMTINGESMDTCFVVAQYLAKALLGKNPLNIEDCCKKMDSIIYANSSIKSAFDIALHDIASQNAELPLYKYLGGENNKTIFTDYTVSIGNPQKMAADAVKIKDNGFQIIKVKLGGAITDDIERIRQIREAVGNEIPIRVDANQGWTVEDSIKILSALEPFNIQHCEEPIPRWDFMNLKKISDTSKIPIMADESCCDEHDAKRLINLQACNMLNVKLGKSSGILRAKKIIILAASANIKIQIGGFLESRLAFTAAAHLALTNNCIEHYDFDTPLMFVEDPVIGGISYGGKGQINITESNGLGASIDEYYLKKQVKVVVQI